MAKAEPSSGFLSKVARFVRHPTVDWAELDARTAGVDEERAALKAAMQRKRRNDKVRHHELNELRELMARQRQSAEALEGRGNGDAAASLASGGPSDKSRTIEQIARIEEQMASNWLPPSRSASTEGTSPSSTLTIPARLDGAATVPAHLRMRSASSTSFPMTIDVVTADANTAAPDDDTVLSHPVIAEAAVRFANGQSAEAQQALRGLMAQEGLTPVARTATLVLLDVLHALSDVEGFEELAAEYAERYAAPVPVWPGSRRSAPKAEATDGGLAGLVPGARARVWSCPMLLDAEAVAELGRTTHSGDGPVWLDWTPLVSADVPAAQALLMLAEGWLDRPMDVRMRGAAVLRRRLKASTPSGRDENDRVWWHLRLAMLRIMRRRDEFDLAALDYCVTYGVVPPEWTEPRCQFQVAEEVPSAVAELPVDGMQAGEPLQPLSTQLAGLDVHEWPAVATTLPGADTQFPSQTVMQSLWPAAPGAARPVLEGQLIGGIAPVLTALDGATEVHNPGEPLRIDCQRLLRVDFAAAGSLLQWFMAAGGRGIRTELAEVSLIIGAFFHVVGIDEAVTVRLRQY